ncbi:ZIP family metal transporter [Flavobacteriaceae bacterium F08102]|nr:ZIP family metal transporter [Flavobacteriaceae bacterium F08102]
MSIVILIASIIAGIAIVLLLKPTRQIVQLLLAFSGAYLLSMTVLHLMPEVFTEHNHQIGLFVLLGILIQTILEFFSKGAEHGHVHGHDNGVPTLLMISLCIHALIEGLPLGQATNTLLLWSIVIHKVPIAIVLFSFLRASHLKNSQVYVLMLIFALMSPLGFLLSSNAWLHAYHQQISAVVIGVFLHIATAILFENSQNHQFNFRKFIVVLIGFALAFLGTQLGH